MPLKKGKKKDRPAVTNAWSEPARPGAKEAQTAAATATASEPDGSMDITMPRREKLRNCGRLLTFNDPALEVEYVRELHLLNSRSTSRVLMIFAILSILEFFVNKCWTLLSDKDAAATAAFVSRIASMMLCLGSLLVAHLDLFSYENLAFAISVVFCGMFFMTNGYRMSKIFGTEWWKSRYLDDCDADSCISDTTLILSLLGIVLANLVFVSMRVCRSWLIILVTAFAYAVMGYAFGPMSALDTTLSLMMYTALCTFNWVGGYQKEMDARRAWYDNRALKMEVLAQKQANEEQEKRVKEIEERLAAMAGPTPQKQSATAGGQANGVVEKKAVGKAPLPPKRTASSALEMDLTKCPNVILARNMQNLNADKSKTHRMAERIRDPSYGMKEFFQDCVEAFPELSLFFVSEADSASSGNAGEMEYQRTVGALFAVYWCMRLDIDGRQGFCYGCDAESWKVRSSPLEGDLDAAKRQAFVDNMEWSTMQDVVNLSVGNSVDRIEAMLCLTAFHDILKVSELCPTVAPEHAPYHGYAEGAVINDHDIALAYILECYPELLPTFRILPADSRRVVLFTQNKMQFNHGWFVQAEAPPGPMLSSLKSILKGCSGGDLAFYFFHWLTDLSGAEGTPMSGADKFTVKFPRPVLAAFLWSMPYLSHLEQKSETEVVEEYLQARFRSALPDVPLPKGPDAMACLRLVTMAQSSPGVALEAFKKAQKNTRLTLAEEMARTGADGQTYVESPVSGSPAILVYYGPALLQRCQGIEEMSKALKALAAVYRAGRLLFPIGEPVSSVTLTIGSLKSMTIADAVAGPTEKGRLLWVLVKQNDREAVLQLLDGDAINELIQLKTKFVAMHPGEPEVVYGSEASIVISKDIAVLHPSPPAGGSHKVAPA